MAESRVETTSGRYRGIHVDGVHSFLGIRYAQAPQRFRPAAPAPGHTGTVDALTYGPAALQYDIRLAPASSRAGTAELFFPHGGSQTEGRPTSEDCLTLNVWTPTTDPAASLPVMVWIHGGVFRVGSASATVTYGGPLASLGRAVVVGVNHRLGIPGFLAVDHLLGDDFAGSGAAGLGDIALALEWIAANARTFGGDANNVTVFGQSGGGGKAAMLLDVPRARGLFHRLVVQSGAGEPLDEDAGREQTDRVLHATGLRTADAGALLTMEPARLVEAQALLSGEGLGPFPVADGTSLLAGDAESSTGVPILLGHTTHDWSFMIADRPWYATLDDADLPAALARVVPGADPATLRDHRERYPDESPPLLLSRVATEHTFGLAAARLAERRAATSAVYRYEFAYETDAWPVPVGATHCLDLPFVFGTVDWARIAGNRPGRHALAHAVSDAWLSFAQSGVPRRPGGETWPRFETGRATTVVIDHPHWSVKSSTPAAGVEAYRPVARDAMGVRARPARATLEHASTAPPGGTDGTTREDRR